MKSASSSGALTQIVQVEDAFRETAKKPRHAALEYLAAWTQHTGARHQFRRQRDELMLVAAGAVQHQQRRRSRRRGGW